MPSKSQIKRQKRQISYQSEKQRKIQKEQQVIQQKQASSSAGCKKNAQLGKPAPAGSVASASVPTSTSIGAQRQISGGEAQEVGVQADQRHSEVQLPARDVHTAAEHGPLPDVPGPSVRPESQCADGNADENAGDQPTAALASDQQCVHKVEQSQHLYYNGKKFLLLTSTKTKKEMDQIIVQKGCKVSIGKKEWKTRTFMCRHCKSCPFMLFTKKQVGIKRFHKWQFDIYAHSEHNHPVKKITSHKHFLAPPNVVFDHEKPPPEYTSVEGHKLTFLRTFDNDNAVVQFCKENFCEKNGQIRRCEHFRSRRCQFLLAVYRSTEQRNRDSYHVYQYAKHTATCRLQMRGICGQKGGRKKNIGKKCLLRGCVKTEGLFSRLSCGHYFHSGCLWSCCRHKYKNNFRQTCNFCSKPTRVCVRCLQYIPWKIPVVKLPCGNFVHAREHEELLQMHKYCFCLKIHRDDWMEEQTEENSVE